VSQRLHIRISAGARHCHIPNDWLVAPPWMPSRHLLFAWKRLAGYMATGIYAEEKLEVRVRLLPAHHSMLDGMLFCPGMLTNNAVKITGVDLYSAMTRVWNA